MTLEIAAEILPTAPEDAQGYRDDALCCVDTWAQQDGFEIVRSLNHRMVWVEGSFSASPVPPLP